MIALECSDNKITAVHEDGFGRLVRVDLSAFNQLDGWEKLIVRPVLLFMHRLSMRSLNGYLRVLADLGRTLRREKVFNLPKAEWDWQELVLRIQHSIITNPDSKASLNTRIDVTLQITNLFLRHLQEEGVIPLGVEVLDFRTLCSPKEYRNTFDSILGETQPERLKEPASKLLCSVSLARTDAAYLDEIQIDLSNKRQCLKRALLAYFNGMVAHAEWGRDAIASVDVDGIISTIESMKKSGYGGGHLRKTHICSPVDRDGIVRYLAVSKKIYDDIPAELDAYDVLPRIREPTNMNVCGLENPFGVDQEEYEHGQLAKLRMRWALGIITTRDVAVMAALLIMEHPRFTPESITMAKLVDKDGQLNLVLGDGSETFEVIKNRAKAIKREHLTELGSRILHFAIEFTEASRKSLKAAGSVAADLLFICKTPLVKSQFGPPDHKRCNLFLSAAGGQNKMPWLGSFYPSLKDSGLDKRTISFKKIRCTEGVLEWFRNGDVDAVSKRLGNKTRTVIKHYIPPALLAAWNTRLIRRFQNLWICVAAAGEDFLLEVTDFHNSTDLLAFINQMLVDHSLGSSPLADRLHAAFDLNAQGEGASVTESSLAVSISKQILATLYSYCDAVLDAGPSPDLLLSGNSNGALNPKQVMDLGTLLRHSLPRHDNHDFRVAHEQAEDAAASVRGKTNWAKILLEAA